MGGVRGLAQQSKRSILVGWRTHLVQPRQSAPFALSRTNSLNFPGERERERANEFEIDSVRWYFGGGCTTVEVHRICFSAESLKVEGKAHGTLQVPA